MPISSFCKCCAPIVGGCGCIERGKSWARNPAPRRPITRRSRSKPADSQNNQLLQQNYANRPTQTDAYGNTTSWNATAGTDPATGKPVTQWAQTSTLSPQLQQAYNSQLQMQQGRSDIANSLMPQVAQQFGQQIDFSNFTPLAQGAQAGTYAPTTVSADGSITGQQQYNTGLSQTPQLQTSLNYGGLQGVQDSSQSRDTAFNQLYGQATSRLDPQWQQQQTQLQTQLANQGITQGSSAYQQAMDQFNRQKTDAYNQATSSAQAGASQQATANNAIDMGLRQQQVAEAGNQGQFGNTALGQMFQFGNAANAQQLAAQQAASQQGLSYGQLGLSQQNQAFNQNLQGGAQDFSQQQAAASYQNQLRQQQIAEAQQQQNWSLNALNALLSGQQVSNPTFANFNASQQGAGTNYSQAGQDQFQAGMQQQQMQNQAIGQAVQGASGIASMFMMSDRRVKADVVSIGRHARGFGVYRYRFIGERGSRVGVMAQEVRRVMPSAVRDIGGVLHVNYWALDNLG